MRFKITLKSEGKNFFIPFNYNYLLSSIIYKNISDLDLASKLHSSKSFKFFTFSQIQVPNHRITKKGIISRDGVFNFFVSSPNDYLIKTMIQSYVDDSVVNFNGQNVNVDRIELLPLPFISDSMDFKTISPVLVRTKREVDGKLKIWDLEPGDKFFSNLRTNLIRKYLEFNNLETTSKEINFSSKMRKVKSRRISIKTGEDITYHRAYFMDLKLEGDPKLIEFAYNGGVGEKGSLGFGMLNINGNEG